tara:strand:+ start:233 stop:430 length:198 start_codon:yes stop_codon:yes gene_type:complete
MSPLKRLSKCSWYPKYLIAECKLVFDSIIGAKKLMMMKKKRPKSVKRNASIGFSVNEETQRPKAV